MSQTIEMFVNMENMLKWKTNKKKLPRVVCKSKEKNNRAETDIPL